MKIEPLADRVIVEPMDTDDGTQMIGSLYVPQTSKEQPTIGTVVACGPGAWQDGEFRAMTLEVGDLVIYGKYSGSEVEIEGQGVLFMRESDIMGKVRYEEEDHDA